MGSGPPTWLRRTEARDRYRNRPSHPPRPHRALCRPAWQSRSHVPERVSPPRLAATESAVFGSSVLCCLSMPWFYSKSFAKLPGAPSASALGHNLLETLTLRAHVQMRASVESPVVDAGRGRIPAKRPFQPPQRMVVLPSRRASTRCAKISLDQTSRKNQEL